jgi:F-type H+-transporting ATPase subunit epsilon
MADLTCLVVTPDEKALEEPADFAALPLYDGEIGIAPGRTPLIGRLGLGELRLTLGDETRCYFIEGGFVEVASNVISILTNRAVPASQLSVQEAEEELQAAREQTANTPKLMAARDRAVTHARARLQVARRAESW